MFCASLVLIGWAFDITVFKSLLPSLASMKPNTAVLFVAVGTSLYLQHKNPIRFHFLIRLLAVFIVLTATFTSFEYLFDWNFGIDELLFRETAAHINQPPGRMSPITAVNFILLGLSILLFDVRVGLSKQVPTEWLALLGVAISFLSLVGYGYGVESLYKIAPFASVALHTATLFMICNLGILFAQPEAGIMSYISSDSAAGITARRLLPAAIFLPATIGWLRLQGELNGLYDLRFGLTLFATANITCFVFLVVWNTVIIMRSDWARRKAELESQDNEENLRITLNSIGDAVIATDINGRIKRMNPVAEYLTGYTLPQSLGHHLDDIFHVVAEPTLHAIESPIGKVLREGALNISHQNHAQLISKDGARRSIVSSTAPILDTEDQLRGAVVVFRDQTEERKAEQLRRESELLRRENEVTIAANNELEAFCYTVSHDLRAPLRAIDGFSKILQEEAANLPAETKGYLTRVSENSQKMGQLIDDLLAFSRLSRHAMNMQKVDISVLTKQTIDEFRNEIEERHVKVELRQLPECKGDPALLKQVLINLLSNAFKYSRSKTDPAIEIGSTTSNNGEENVYFIKDNGVGFDMKYSDKLFGVFQRLHKAEEFEGTGVGLAIAKRVIDRHGGKIWAEAETNRGATFYFTLNKDPN